MTAMKKALFLLLFAVSLFTTQAQNVPKFQTKPDTISTQETLSAVQPQMVMVTKQPESEAEIEADRIQRLHDNEHEDEVLRISATIFVMVIIMIFIVIMVRTYMDYKLRHKILENNVQPDSLNALLDIAPQDRRVSNLRWVFALAGIGFGLHLGGYVRFGVHSVAIMCLCLAASFLAFHFIVLRKKS